MLSRRPVNKSSGNAGTMANVFCIKDMNSQHNGLNGEFLLYQVILKRLLAQGLTDESKTTTLCAHFEPTDETDRRLMTEFDESYRSDRAIYWYTRESCIYRLLNKALRTQNIFDIIAFTQFIRDLYSQLAYEQISLLVTAPSRNMQVYRGQLISVDEVNRIQYAKGQLISMNSFLSTSTNRAQALQFAQSGTPNETLTTILLEIQLNLEVMSRPYADVKALSAFAQEDEVLFMFGCIFRIDKIWFDKQLKIWRAQLTLCSDEDEDLKRFEQDLENGLKGKNMLLCLGTYMIEMEKFDQAEEHFRNLLDKKYIHNDLDFATCYHGLSQVNEKKGEYDDANKHLHIAIDYLQKNPKHKDHSLLAQCYNDLGLVYSYERDSTLALESYERALQIKTNKPALTYSRLSKLHMKLGNFTIALQYQNQSLRHLPPSSPLVADTLIEVGKIFAETKQYASATKIFQRAIQHQQRALSADHPDIGYSYLAMGTMYSKFDKDEKALQCFNRALQLQSKSLPSNHTDFGKTFEHFALLYEKKKDYEQALIYLNKLLANQLKTYSIKHPAVAETYALMGQTYLAKKDYENALLYFDKLLQNQLERLAPGNPAITETYNLLADTNMENDDIDQALVYLHKALKNDLEKKLADDPSLTETYHTIANIYLKREEHSMALIHLNRLIDCQARRKPIDVVGIDQTYAKVADLYSRTNFFQSSLTYFGGFLSIQLQNQLSDQLQIRESFQMIENVHFEKRHLDYVLRYFQQAVKVRSETLPSGHPELTHLYHVLGNIQLEKANFTDALASFQSSLDNQLQSKSPDDPSLVDTYDTIAKIHVQLRNFPQALLYLDHLLRTQLKADASDHEKLAGIYTVIAETYFHQSSFTKAVSYFNKSIDSQLLTGTSRRLKETYNNIGQVFLKVPRFLDTLNKPETTFLIKRHLPKSLRILTLLNGNLREHRHFDRLVTYFAQLPFEQAASSRLSPSDCNQIVANIYLETREYQLAVKYFRKLAYEQRKQIPSDDSRLIETYQSIAVIYFEMEDWRNCLVYFYKLIHTHLKTRLPEDPALATIYETIAKIHFREHHLAQALFYFNWLLDCQSQSKIPNEHLLRMQTYEWIAKIYLKTEYFRSSSKHILTDLASSYSFKMIEGKHFDTRHRDQALSFFQEQLKEFSAGDRRLTAVYTTMANIYLVKHQYDHALVFYHHVLSNELKRKKLDDPSIAKAYQITAFVYFHQDALNDALLFFYRSLHCRRRNQSVEQPAILESYTMIATIYSIKHLSQHLQNESAYLEKLFATSTDGQFTHIQSLIETYDKINGDKFKARYTDHVLEYFQTLHREQIESGTSQNDVLLIMANIFVDKRNYEQALTYYNMFIQKSEPTLDSSLADVLAAMGNLYSETGQFSRGIVQYQTALSIYEKNYPATKLKIEKVKENINRIITTLQN